MSLSKGQFEAEINEIEKFLNKREILEERNYFPSIDFDPAVYRKKNYVENWKSLISDNIYTFLLTDNSIFNFKFDSALKSISFTFFECPYNCQTYKEYLDENGLSDHEGEKVFEDYYEVYLFQCALKENPLMIRYDLDYNSYSVGTHPVSHIHIGHKNQIRVGIDKVLHPKSFVNFILRQHYPSTWKQILEFENEWIKYFLKEKALLPKIDQTNWKEFDRAELFFT